MDAGVEHIATEETRNEVKLLISFGHSEESVADYLDLTPPTFRKHYKEETKIARHYLELSAGATCVENLRDENASVRQKAAEFILSRKCKWTDKNMTEQVKDAILEGIINKAAEEMLVKKEQESEY